MTAKTPNFLNIANFINLSYDYINKTIKICQHTLKLGAIFLITLFILIQGAIAIKIMTCDIHDSYLFFFKRKKPKNCQ
jgi:hypothetical protein